nr:transposase [Ectothiorhodospira haloalkaliphila]
MHEAGRAVAPVVERDIAPLIREAELLHVDETGWKEGKQLLWLWVFTCTTATLYAIGRRSRRILHMTLGEAFVGWLMSDGFWAYRDYDRRLRCLAHLIRKAHGLDRASTHWRVRLAPPPWRCSRTCSSKSTRPGKSHSLRPICTRKTAASSTPSVTCA